MKVTTRGAIEKWLQALTQRYTVIAPQLVEGQLLFRQVDSKSAVVLEFERTTMSPKGYLLPPSEVILEVEKRGGEVSITECVESQAQVIVAVRPCDARAFQALDALLLDRPPSDAFYAERRRNTVLVGLACPRLWDGCFCTSLGSAPDDASAVDVMLYQEDGAYLVQEVTARGTVVLDGLEAEDTERTAPPSEIAGDEVPVLDPADWRERFEDGYWQRLGERCLSCHVCTYVCPTCRCFDVRDDLMVADAGYARSLRVRAWDSCMAAAYRRIAGGHNTRPDRVQRLRNRYFCRFCYSPLEFGAVACVGCGRCSAACPVGIDVAEVLTDLFRLEVRGQQPDTLETSLASGEGSVL
jgi:ferredoxin